MHKIQWGIIGCGNVTEVKSGPAFNKVADSSLVAVMRRNAEKAEDYAKRHNVPKWYNNARDLINDPEVNAVYIATPPDSHEQYALAALAAGKPVYIEKPMSLDAAAAQNIVSAAGQHNTKVSIAHYRRELPIFKHIRDMLDEKALGEVKHVTIKYYQAYDAKGFAPSPDNWRLVPAVSGGGIFHDLAPHQLDLMLYFFGLPQFAEGVSLNQGGYYEADDFVTGHAVFANNIVLNGIWSFNAPAHMQTDECVIVGSKGSLRFPVFTMNKLYFSNNEGETEFDFDVPAHVQQPMIAAVVQYFCGRMNNPCSAETGVEVMKLIDAFTARK